MGGDSIVSCEVSLYPHGTTDGGSIINESVEYLRQKGLKCEVGPISTKVTGDSEQVWRGLESMFSNAKRQNEDVSMVVNISTR